MTFRLFLLLFGMLAFAACGDSCKTGQVERGHLGLIIYPPTESLDEMREVFDSFARDMQLPKRYKRIPPNHAFSQQRFHRPGWYTLRFMMMPRSPDYIHRPVSASFLVTTERILDPHQHMYPDAAKLIRHLKSAWGEDLLIQVGCGGDPSLGLDESAYVNPGKLCQGQINPTVD